MADDFINTLAYLCTVAHSENGPTGTKNFQLRKQVKNNYNK